MSSYKFNEKELETLTRLHTEIEKISDDGHTIASITSLAAIKTSVKLTITDVPVVVFLCAALYGLEEKNSEYKELRVRLEKHFNLKGV